MSKFVAHCKSHYTNMIKNEKFCLQKLTKCTTTGSLRLYLLTNSRKINQNASKFTGLLSGRMIVFVVIKIVGGCMDRKL